MVICSHSLIINHIINTCTWPRHCAAQNQTSQCPHPTQSDLPKSVMPSYALQLRFFPGPQLLLLHLSVYVLYHFRPPKFVAMFWAGILWQNYNFLVPTWRYEWARDERNINKFCLIWWIILKIHIFEHFTNWTL